MKKLIDCLNDLTREEQKKFLIYFFSTVLILSLPLIFVRLEYDFHLYLLPMFITAILVSFKSAGVLDKLIGKRHDLICLIVFIMTPFLTALLAAPSYGICILYNTLIIAVPYFILFLIFRNALVCTIPVTVLCYLLHLTNEIMIIFRGTRLKISDFAALKTALTVASNYSLKITQSMYYPLLGTVLVITLAVLFNFSFKKTEVKKLKAVSQILSVLTLILSTCFIVLEFKGDKHLYNWYNQDGDKYQGVCYSLFSGLVDGYLKPPEGYTRDEVDQILGRYEITEGSRTPNVIVIMNEAFSDLSQLYDLDSQDYMPFINSLDENVTKGKAVVSYFGGATCNSEYEFLTGNTMEFLPDGSYPYIQYIKNDINTFYSDLDSSIYSKKYIHPYIASNWHRSSIFMFLGFDEFLDGLAFSTQDTYDGDEAVKSDRDYKFRYEGVELIRGYISDGATYDKVIELYENKPENSRISQFVVTMQNHSPYNYEGDDFVAEAFSGTKYDRIDQYLSLVKISDAEVKELISYFSDVEEDTVICFFGDHLPNLGMGSLDTSLSRNKEYIYNNYSTPFFIWTNFESETEYLDHVSLNYLSLLVKEKAGLPLTQFDGFRKELYQKYPVLSANIIVDSEGNCYFDSAETGDPIVMDYQYLQYNSLFD